MEEGSSSEHKTALALVVARAVAGGAVSVGAVSVGAVAVGAVAEETVAQEVGAWSQMPMRNGQGWNEANEMLNVNRNQAQSQPYSRSMDAAAVVVVGAGAAEIGLQAKGSHHRYLLLPFLFFDPHRQDSFHGCQGP